MEFLNTETIRKYNDSKKILEGLKNGKTLSNTEAEEMFKKYAFLSE